MASTTTYKTPAAAAQAMAAQWFAMVPDVAAQSTPKDLAWWVKQIQQDGSKTAFANFSSGILKQHGPAAAKELQDAATAAAQQTGAAPWTPPGGQTGDPKTDQLAGTNTKNFSGTLQQNPVMAAIAAAVTQMNPAAAVGMLAANKSGGTGLDYLKGGAGAMAVAAPFAGAVSGAANKLVNPPSLPTAGPMSPGGVTPQDALKILSNPNSTPEQIASLSQDYGSPAGQAALYQAAGLPNPSGIGGSSSGASGSPGGPSGTPGAGSSGLPSWLTGVLGVAAPVLGGLNVANLSKMSQDQAANALKTQTGLWDSYGKPLLDTGMTGMKNASAMMPTISDFNQLKGISAGLPNQSNLDNLTNISTNNANALGKITAGMPDVSNFGQNLSTPAPTMANIAQMGQISARGNPFGMPAVTPVQPPPPPPGAGTPGGIVPPPISTGGGPGGTGTGIKPPPVGMSA